MTKIQIKDFLNRMEDLPFVPIQLLRYKEILLEAFLLVKIFKKLNPKMTSSDTSKFAIIAFEEGSISVRIAPLSILTTTTVGLDFIK